MKTSAFSLTLVVDEAELLLVVDVDEDALAVVSVASFAFI
ncbi:hypothetical protein ABENE_18230 [Asticcacaulis benevestitus DSM 16100 = ATCC BAA-896]|uniref:Uncharacterized protein n=1 Tax=Asticcacaulis benevestitus DSM 16100 = ATCC BAA-896 TaxID=1121022 RepID=V4PM62_9CAUL|nr:hypothetical protein ABENE_18230 [Asticcacaulis benevestitus DSM 16100 = ATCC BAA-896]